MSDFDQLVDKKILSVEINPSKTFLRFNLDDSTSVVYEAEGDCCSSSWFEAINGLDNLIGQTVHGVEEKPEFTSDGSDVKFNGDSNPDRDTFIKVYGFTIRTIKGYTDIEMRNSSNGYYGGMITPHDEPEAEDLAELQPLTKDF